MNQRFEAAVRDDAVAGDIRIVAAFAAIYCKAQHRDRTRTFLDSDASELGVYGKKVPVLCDECAAHISYAEKRRAYCPKDPKPFCAHCDSHCYKADESAWQNRMMRFSGPRSVFYGYAIPGMKHALEAVKWRREQKRRDAETAG